MTKLYRFPKGEHFRKRLQDGIDDPYHICALGCAFNTVFPVDRVAHYRRWLCETFDAFRTGFHRGADGELSAVLRDSASTMEEIEIETLEAGARAGMLSARPPLGVIDLLAGPLLHVQYITASKEKKSLVRLVFSHFALDGPSQMLMRDATRRLFTGQTARRHGSYIRWMSTGAEYASSPAGAAEAEVWRRACAPHFEPMQQLGRARRGTRRFHLQLNLESSLVGRLMRCCQRDWRCRLVEAMGAATSLGLSRAYNLPVIGMSWTGHGRYPINNIPFDDTLGWLTDFHPLVIPCTPSRRSEIMQAFRSSLYRTPNMGASFPWLAAFPPAGTPLGPKFVTPFRVNYREGALPDEKVRELAAPPAERPNLHCQPRADVSLRDLDVYLTIDIDVASKISLVISGDVSAVDAESVLQHIYESILYFAFERPGEGD